jgi:hypothetical protein
MKASELIKRLQELIDLNGDLQVGYLDIEYDGFDMIEAVDIKTDYSDWDNQDLGKTFIGIE